MIQSILNIFTDVAFYILLYSFLIGMLWGFLLIVLNIY